jgi:hypothetical protein
MARFGWIVLLWLGCTAAPGEPPEPRLEGRTLEVACGRCIFHMPQAQGCPWAAELDGKHYLLQGAVPQAHHSHAPDGICNVSRRAVVDGVLRNGKLIVSRMELLPATDVPSAPRFTPADVH